MRPIDADALIRRWCGIKCGCERDECGREIEPCIVVMAIEEAPTIDRPQGEWISVSGDWIDGPCGAGYFSIRCSVCGYSTYDDDATKFCPNCGARMKGADNEEIYRYGMARKQRQRI